MRRTEALLMTGILTLGIGCAQEEAEPASPPTTEPEVHHVQAAITGFAATLDQTVYGEHWVAYSDQTEPPTGEVRDVVEREVALSCKIIGNGALVLGDEEDDPRCAEFDNCGIISGNDSDHHCGPREVETRYDFTRLEEYVLAACSVEEPRYFERSRSDMQIEPGCEELDGETRRTEREVFTIRLRTENTDSAENGLPEWDVVTVEVSSQQASLYGMNDNVMLTFAGGEPTDIARLGRR